jgi:hypothetical protein
MELNNHLANFFEEKGPNPLHRTKHIIGGERLSCVCVSHILMTAVQR